MDNNYDNNNILKENFIGRENHIIITDSKEKSATDFSWNNLIKHIIKYKYFICIFTIICSLFGFLIPNYIVNPNRETFSTTIKVNLPVDITTYDYLDIFSDSNIRKLNNIQTDNKYDIENIISSSDITATIYTDKTQNASGNQKNIIELSGKTKAFSSNEQIESFINDMLLVSYNSEKTKYENYNFIDLPTGTSFTIIMENIQRAINSFKSLIDNLISSYGAYTTISIDSNDKSEEFQLIQLRDFFTYNLNIVETNYIDWNTFKVVNGYTSRDLITSSGSFLTNDQISTYDQQLTEELCENFAFVNIDDVENILDIQKRLQYDLVSIKNKISLLNEDLKLVEEQIQSFKPTIDDNGVLIYPETYYKLVSKKNNLLDDIASEKRMYTFTNGQLVNSSRNFTTPNESTKKYLENKDNFNLSINNLISKVNDINSRIDNIYKELPKSVSLFSYYGSKTINFSKTLNPIIFMLISCFASLFIGIVFASILGQYKIKNVSKHENSIAISNITPKNNDKDFSYGEDLTEKSKKYNEEFDKDYMNKNNNNKK